MASRSTRWTILKIEQLSLLATVVIAFAALAALVLTGQAGIRQDLRTSHATLLAGQVELRREIKSLETELRKEIKSVETELRKELKAVETELRKDMRAGQAELRNDLHTVEAELRAGQAGIRKDLKSVEVRLKSVEVRLAVVEQRTAGLSGEPGASAAEPAPAGSLDGRHHSARATILLASAVTAPFRSVAWSGPIH